MRNQYTVFIFFLCISTPFFSKAQDNPFEKMNGPYLTLNTHGDYFNHENLNGLFGAGIGGRLGIAFKSFSVYTGLTISGLSGRRLSDTYENTGLLYLKYEIVGTQIHFRTSDPALIPYTEANLSIIALSVPQEKDNSVGFHLPVAPGAGVSVGGGTKYFLSNSFSLDGGLSLSYLSHGESYSSISVQLNAGFSWYPF